MTIYIVFKIGGDDTFISAHTTEYGATKEKERLTERLKDRLKEISIHYKVNPNLAESHYYIEERNLHN